MFTLREIQALELGQVKVEKSLDINTSTITVIVESFDKVKATAILKEQTPVGFKWLYGNIDFMPYRVITTDFDKRFGMFPVFGHRGEFCLLNHKDKKEFAIHPAFPFLAINREGTLVYDLRENKFILIRNNVGGFKYKTVTINDNGRFINRTVHRLVAEVWIPNGNYVENYIVDHIDGNKVNNSVKNLRWVSSNINVGRHSNNNDKHLDYRYGLMNVENGKIYYFVSLAKLGDFLGLDKRTLNSRPLPFYTEVNGTGFIIEDLGKFTNWKLLKDLNKYKYQYKVVTPENEIMYFRSWRDIAKKFGIAVNSIVTVGGNLFEVLKERLKVKNIRASYIGVIKTFNQFTSEKYKVQAKDLDTGKIITVDSTKEMIIALGGSPTNKSVIIVRLNGNKREGIPYEIDGKRYLIRKSDEPWPELRNITSKRQSIVHIPTGRIFKSLREAERETNRTRGFITNCIISLKCTEFKKV